MNSSLHMRDSMRQVRDCKLPTAVEIAHQTMMKPTSDEIRQWLRGALAKSGLNPAALAKKASIAPSTLTRFLGGSGNLSFDTVTKISHATGIAPPMTPEEPESLAPAPAFFENEGEPFDYLSAERPKTRVDTALAALIGDRPAADPWRLASTVLEDAGYLPGDILVVDLNARPVEGDVVCAQVYQWQKGTADTVFRIYKPPFLLAATRILLLRKPLLVDNETVIIKGVVTDALRVAQRPASH
jgi:DNA-binding phage protein